MASMNHKMTLLIYILISTLFVVVLLATTASSAATSEFDPSDKSEVLTHGSSVDKQSMVANKVMKQMQIMQQKLDEFSQSINKRAKDPATPPKAQKCFVECNEDVNVAIDGVKKTLVSLGAQNIDKANFDITAISNNIGSCHECFVEMGEEEPSVKKIDDWVRGITDEALASLDAASG
ncbi:hypothetical protein L6452_03999 [Arctium lappa]|uniref:Uncharacterized protein n=1 Tax=Arctium lappa TaxID=4217 RepID=A0ACB9FPQ7_ARCLA|nr:hypothetical protein L6452_03999 [Arctium lappa]